MLASVQVQPSLVRRQIEQLQQSAGKGRLPPHLSGTPLRPRLTRARTNLDAVWRSLSENRDPLDGLGLGLGGKAAAWADGALPRPRPRGGDDQGNAGGLCAVAALVSRSATHLHQAHLRDVKEGTTTASLRQPLRTIQGTSFVKPRVKPADKPVTPFKQAAKVATGHASPDAVYHTIDEKDAKQAVHYDKPVSPPVPVDPSRRKRFAVDKPDAREEHRTAKAHAAAAAQGAQGAEAPAKPRPGPKPSARPSLGPERHSTLPRKLSVAVPRVVDIDITSSVILRSSSSLSSSPCPSSSSSTLPLKKSARGSHLWKTFSSFNPVSRWDDWSNSKKSESKRVTSVSSSTKSVQLDQRPPVPNRPLPPTPRPQQEKPIADAARGGLLPANLDHQPWFHNVDRKQAEELIKNGVDGYFLIRPSSQSQNPLTLTLWYNQRVYNISVRQRKDGRIALGFEKPDEQSFSSIEEMVINYQSENLLLFSRNERTGRTVLKKSPPKLSH